MIRGAAPIVPLYRCLMESADGDGVASRKSTLDAKALCFAHVHDEYLAAELRDTAQQGECAFCSEMSGGRVRVVPVTQLADVVQGALSGFGRGADAPVKQADPDSRKVPLDPAEALAQACESALDTDVLRALQDCVDQREWGDLFTFMPRSSAVRDSWDWLCRTVEERDLDLPPADAPLPGSDRNRLESFMGRIVGIIHEEHLIKLVEPGEKIWRGRMRADDIPPGYRAVDIGSAPPERAADNRMSRAGVPLFYGSADSGTAVVEISARDNRPFAAVVAFETTRPLKVLDLMETPEPPSLFDREQVARCDSLDFLRHFAGDLSRLVFYDGRPHRDYRPTQYVTDYFRESAELRVDGIRFRSAHNGGVNYALFVDSGECLDADATDSEGTLRLIEGSERVEPRGWGHLTRR